jgi:NADH:ubiquinone oxidoreductase subunit 4 (subunit M)
VLFGIKVANVYKERTASIARFIASYTLNMEKEAFSETSVPIQKLQSHIPDVSNHNIVYIVVRAVLELGLTTNPNVAKSMLMRQAYCDVQ